MGFLYDLWENPGATVRRTFCGAEDEPEWKKEIRRKEQQRHEDGDEGRTDPYKGSR